MTSSFERLAPSFPLFQLVLVVMTSISRKTIRLSFFLLICFLNTGNSPALSKSETKSYKETQPNKELLASTKHMANSKQERLVIDSGNKHSWQIPRGLFQLDPRFFAFPKTNDSQFIARSIDSEGSELRPGVLARKARAAGHGPQETEVFTVFFGRQDGSSPTSPAEQIDCGRLPLKSPEVSIDNTFHIETRRNVTGGEARTQLMYADEEHLQPTSSEFRGELLCDESNNSLSFKIPGRLLGGANVEVRAMAYSKTGLIARHTFRYEVEPPEIVVDLTKVRNNSSKKNWDVRNPFKPSKGRADIYLVGQGILNTGRPTADRERPPAIAAPPQLGIWGNVPRDGERRPSETEIYNGEVGLGLELGILAYDHDDYKLAQINARLWQLSSAIYCQIEQFCPNVLPRATAPLHKLMQDAIGRGSDDDFMAGIDIKLRSDSDPQASSLVGRNWGLDHMHGRYPSVDGYEIDMGNVTIWLKFREAQPSWHPPVRII